MARLLITDDVKGNAYVGDAYDTGIIDIPFSDSRTAVYFLPYGDVYMRYVTEYGFVYLSLYESIVEIFYAKYTLNDHDSLDVEIIKLSYDKLTEISQKTAHELSEIMDYHEKYAQYRRT
jgi:hypothetical protein